MRIGDLVKYIPTRTVHGLYSEFDKWLGTVVKTIPGTANMCVVVWQNGYKQSIPAENLQVVSKCK